MIRLHFIRHGESEGNIRPQQRFLGRHDPPLTARGETQAQRLGKRFAGMWPAAVFSSSLQRAWRTAELLIAGAGELPLPQMVPELVERSYGTWDGKLLSEIQAAHPEDFQDFQTYRVLPPHGESLAELQERVELCLKRLRASLSDGATALVVTHEGVLRALLGGVLGLYGHRSGWHERFQFWHGSLTTVEWHEDHWTLIRVNETGHLDEW